jgi:hypothetical protein
LCQFMWCLTNAKTTSCKKKWLNDKKKF